MAIAEKLICYDNQRLGELLMLANDVVKSL